MSQRLVCLDMEGVLAPEIWIELARRTGLESLRRTTRDEPDYDKLMRHRLDVLDRHGLGFEALRPIVEALEPLPGAAAFVDALRARYPVVILSDTFREFAGPLMAKMGYPTLFCHRLHVDGDGRIARYELRMPDHKRAAVKAFRALNYEVRAAGDSYNDTAMLGAADEGFLFRAPRRVIDEFPQFPAMTDYADLLAALGAGDGREPGRRREAPPRSPPGGAR